MQRESRIAHYVVGSLTALSLVLLSLPLSLPVRAFKACASYVFDPVSYEGERGVQRLAEAPSRVRELLSADIENHRLQEDRRNHRQHQQPRRRRSGPRRHHHRCTSPRPARRRS